MRTSSALPTTRVTRPTLPRPSTSLPRPGALPSPSAEKVIVEATPALAARALLSPTKGEQAPVIAVSPRPARRATRSDAGSLKITPRDVQILTYLLRYRYATPAHCALLTGSTVRAMEVRLRALRKHGYAAAQRAGWGLEIVWATQNAVDLTGVDLDAGKANPSLATLEHTLTIAWVGASYESGDAGYGVDGEVSVTVTETEMRRSLYRLTYVDRVDPWSDEALPRTQRNDPSALTEYPHACIVHRGAGFSDRIPDLVVVSPDGTRASAIEIERSRKQPRDLDRILQGYVRSDLYDGIVYMVPDTKDGLARLLQERADHVGFARKDAPAFVVTRYNPAEWHASLTAPVRRR